MTDHDHGTPEEQGRDYLATERGREALAFQLAHGMTPTPVETIPDKVVAILKRELPGFESKIHAETNSIRTHGIIRVDGGNKLGMSAAIEAIRYPVSDDEREAEEFARRIVDETRRFVADQVGLEKYIAKIRHEATAEGFRDGRAKGREEGKAEGRAEVMAELGAAMREGGIEL